MEAPNHHEMLKTWTPRSGVSGAYTMSSPDGVQFKAMSTQPSYTGSDTGQVSRESSVEASWREIPAARLLSGGGECRLGSLTSAWGSTSPTAAPGSRKPHNHRGHLGLHSSKSRP